MSDQEIKCSVMSCRFNDKNRYCTLPDIMVGSNAHHSAHASEDTECVSFEPEQ